MPRVIVINWIRLGATVYRRDKVRLQDTGQCLLLSVNGAEVRRGTLREFLKAGWAAWAS